MKNSFRRSGLKLRMRDICMGCMHFYIQNIYTCVRMHVSVCIRDYVHVLSQHKRSISILPSAQGTSLSAGACPEAQE